MTVRPEPQALACPTLELADTSPLRPARTVGAGCGERSCRVRAKTPRAHPRAREGLPTPVEQRPAMGPGAGRGMAGETPLSPPRTRAHTRATHPRHCCLDRPTATPRRGGEREITRSRHPRADGATRSAREDGRRPARRAIRVRRRGRLRLHRAGHLTGSGDPPSSNRLR